MEVEWTDAVWGGMEIESLSPVAKSSITHFEWCGKKVLDNNFRCLSEGYIQELDINPTQFTMEELAELLSFFPKSLKGTITKPYVTMGIYHEDEYIKYHYLCKHKRTCIEKVKMNLDIRTNTCYNACITKKAG